METIRNHIQSLLFERKLACAEWVWDKYHDSLDIATKNYIRRLLKSKEILDEMKILFPSTAPSSSGDSNETPENSDDEIDEETVEYKIEELKRQKKRLTDRIYLLKKKHQYSQDNPESIFGDS